MWDKICENTHEKLKSRRGGKSKLIATKQTKPDAWRKPPSLIRKQISSILITCLLPAPHMEERWNLLERKHQETSLFLNSSSSQGSTYAALSDSTGLLVVSKATCAPKCCIWEDASLLTNTEFLLRSSLFSFFTQHYWVAFTDVSEQPIVSILRSQTAFLNCPLGCPETSVNSQKPTLRRNPEDRRS